MTKRQTIRKNVRHQSRGTGRRRWLGTAVLVLFVVATSGVLPLLVAAAASISQDHRVSVGGYEGGANVVLKHDRALVAKHSHCIVSRTLVFFAQPATGNPDHVLHFGASGAFLREGALTLSPPDAQVSAPLFRESFGLAILPPPAPLSAANPPAPPGALVGVRTTVLLI